MKFPPRFTYPITRENPYTWFSWVVIAGGISAAALLSAINVAANGYELIVDYKDDYNRTVNETRWTGRPPFSWFEKAKPKCQTRDIPVNTQFFTKNSALPYTLTSVRQQGRNGLMDTLPSLKYTNNVLENCTVQYLQIDLEWAQRNAAQQGWVKWGPKALAQMNCSIDNDESPTSFNLTTSYEFFTPTIDTWIPFSFLRQPDRKNQTSLWLGQSLLSFYWLQLSTAMERNFKIQQGVETVLKGSISLLPSVEVDIRSLDFFSPPEYHFTTNKSGTSACCINKGSNGAWTIGDLAQNEVKPMIWIELDSFAKSFYASILADLGQISTGNMLLNTDALEYFTSNLTDKITGQNSAVNQVWQATRPADRNYSELRAQNMIGDLAINTTVISSQYLCQLPRLKSPGSLFIAVLVADLVMLQALWIVVNWTMVTWLEHKNSPSTEEYPMSTMPVSSPSQSTLRLLGPPGSQTTHSRNVSETSMVSRHEALSTPGVHERTGALET